MPESAIARKSTAPRPATGPVTSGGPAPDSPPQTVAAVDLGSNSFHMTVARFVEGQLVVVDRMKEMVRLAAGLDAENRIGEDAVERAMACLGRFGQRLRDMPPGSVRAVGTNTLRRARSPRSVLARARATLGHPIEIISGREEARLIYLGVAHTVAQDQERRLVVDIGGGSTEFIIGRQFTPLQAESLYMGCVGMSRQFFPEGRIRRRSMRAAELAARQELEPIEAPFRGTGWDAAVGASGTILAAHAVIRTWSDAEAGITLPALHRLRDALVDAGRVEKLSLPGLQAERAPVFPGGVAILVAAFESLGIERMHTSEGALREGLLYDLVGRILHEDARESTIAELSRRYQIDAAQAARVERTALALRERVAARWELGEERYASLLGWAARLHEIGLAIAHSGYHKHGAYLLEHGDLPGFSNEEQRLLSVLVRAHRRKFPKSAFRNVPGNGSERMVRLAVLLRAAVVLHRSRSDAPLPELEFEAAPGHLALRFPRGWLAAHPLTEADLAQEAEYLRAAGIRLEFS